MRFGWRSPLDWFVVALGLLGMLLAVSRAHAGTFTAASCSYANVNAVINGPTHTVVDGDVINIPAGTCTWTSNLIPPSNVGFTLIGSGTPSSGSGSTGAAASCHATVIVDNAGSSTFLMAFSPQFGNSTTRLSCMDIEPQSSSTALYAPIQVEGACTSGGCPQFRIDNITFGLTTPWTESGNGAQAGAMARLDDAFGVMDHNTIPSGSNVEFFNAQLNSYLGVGANGDNSWAQPDSLGGANNVFAENNTFFSSYLALNDCEAPGPMGCRVVDRYNTMTAQGASAFGIFENHGTETGGRFRGGREAEVYNNTLNCTISCSSADGGLRSGTGMFYGNVINFTGGAFASGWLGLSLYRVVYAATPWGACGGSGSWDQNDGTVYYSGTMTTGGSGVLTFTDGSKSWTLNQLIPAGDPYSVYDTTQGFWAEIASNTGTTVTIQSPISESGWTGFNNGDSYQILRASHCIDQPGHGQGNYISGATPTPTGWVSQALDPIYQWNDSTTGGNVNAPVNSNTGKVIANRDYYPMASGIQTNATTPFNGTSGTGWGTLANRPTTCTTGVGYGEYSGSSFVQLDKCTATNTWTNAAYTAYTYPHPLTAGVVASGCQLSSGASVSAIQTAINSAAANLCPAPNSSTVNFAAGSYTISSPLSIPCPVAPMTLTGPTPTGAPSDLTLGTGAVWPITPTAVLSSTLGNNWAVSGTACSNGTEIRYLQYNGNLPPGGGGGFLSVPPGMNNLTVRWNWFYGNNAVQQTTQAADTFIYFNGSLSGTQNQNINIQWNRVGKLGGTECGGNGSDGNPAGSNGGLMNLYGSSDPPSVNVCTAYPGGYLGGGYAPPTGSVRCLYQDAVDITHGGGSCGFVGVNNNFANLLIANNSVTDQEEPVKFYECQGSGCNWGSSGLIVRANDFQGVHRIGAETQFNNVSSGANFLYDSNDFVNAIKPNAGMWGLSLPQGTTDSRNNLLIANTALSNDKNGKPGQYFGAALEFWGTGTSSNNMLQGIWGSGINFGFGGSPWSINNNIIQMSASSLYITQEETSCCPAQSGNVTGSTVTTRTSFAPTISPSPGAQAYPLTVTLTDPGYTSGAGPQGNTGIWYTIDGTTPVPGAGSAKYLSTGQTFVLANPATVQAVGMWGALNQPASYPSGFGFVPSAVVSAAYTSGGAVTLTGATISATGGVATLTVGQAVQMIVICHYSDGSTSGCNATDSHGNSVTSWSSSNGSVTVNGSGLATGAVVGTATITAVVTGGTTTSPGAGLTVSAPPLTLSSTTVATTGGVSSITAPATNQLLTTCHYNDGSTTSCNAIDSHGNAVTSAASSAPSIATVTSPGSLVTGVAAGTTNLTTTVTPTPSMLGTSLQNVSGATGNGFINEIYGVTGTSASGYTPGDCHITIQATTNWTAGKLWTCLLVLAPTPTTQSATALCSNSFTMTGTSWPGGDIVIPMGSVCPTLPPDQGYWVGSTTNQTTASPAQGFSNCGGNCSGGPPLFGSGTYSYSYVANPFGTYTSLPTTLNQTGTTPGHQVSQYILLTTTPVTSNTLPLTVNAAAPTLVSAYITGASSLMVPNTAQMAAKCHYSSGPDQDCTVADIYGDAVSAWLTSDATKATVQNVGAASPGLVTAVAAGTPSITAVINNAMNSTAYPITVTNPAVSLTGITLSTAGGITGLFQGNTNQLKATCSYSDGSNDDCTNTDAHGNKANTWTSTTPGHASINSTSGLVTGVAPGGTTFTAKAGTFTSPALPLTVLTIPSGVYAITIRGPIRFSGTVRF